MGNDQNSISVTIQGYRPAFPRPSLGIPSLSRYFFLDVQQPSLTREREKNESGLKNIIKKGRRV